MVRFGSPSLSRVLAGLVRRTWLVVLVTVSVCSVFTAHAVAALASARYLDSSPTAPHHLVAVSVEEPAPVPPAPDGSAFVERNIFCSTCTPLTPGLGGPGPTNAPFIPDALLIATSLGATSIATLRVPRTEVQGDFAVGDIVPGLGEITRIGFTTVDVTDRDGRTGTLSLRTPLESGGGRDVGAANPDPAAAASATPGIVKLDETTYEVERGFVRDLVSGSVKTAGARIIPVSKDGKLDGLRMAGVRAGTLAANLGLQNGDVLIAVNNAKIESANTLLDLYAQLDKLSTVELSGTRRGTPLTLTLRLR